MAYSDCGHCKLVSGGGKREKKPHPPNDPKKNHNGEIKKSTPKNKLCQWETEEIDIMDRVMDPCA